MDAPIHPLADLPVGTVHTLITFGEIPKDITYGKTKWLICNGRVINAKEYPEVAKMIGPLFGGTPQEPKLPNSIQLGAPFPNSKSYAIIRVR